jgi:hypothetical protein
VRSIESSLTPLPTKSGPPHPITISLSPHLFVMRDVARFLGHNRPEFGRI